MTVYEIITGRIVELLDKGVIPWQMPWDSKMPMNLVSGREYRGINIMLLSFTSFGSHYWLTFKQAKSMGGSVKAGATGFPVVFWSMIKVKDEETQKEKTVPFLRYHTVFNVKQCNNITVPQDSTRTEFNPIEECERVIEGMPNRPEIKYGFNGACYIPSLDEVRMPNKESFHSTEEFYSTLYHEILHSTASEKRLNRNTINKAHAFGGTEYSFEELCAEIGSSFLCAHTGISSQTIKNNASYIGSWLKRLKDDKSLIIKAAGQAQKACDYILNKQHTEAGN